MGGKKITRYSNVALLDVIRNSSDSLVVNAAKSELKSRNLSDFQMAELESNYLKFKEFQERRKDMSLTRDEWLNLFLLPFFTPKPHWRNDHYSQSEMDRYQKYGFEKKIKQAETVKVLGTLFWLFLIVIGVILYSMFL
jgi:hypothetical protein